MTLFVIAAIFLAMAGYGVYLRGKDSGAIRKKTAALEDNVTAQKELVVALERNVSAHEGLVVALQNELSVKNELIAAMEQRLADQGAIMRAAFPHMVIFNKEEAPCDR